MCGVRRGASATEYPAAVYTGSQQSSITTNAPEMHQSDSAQGRRIEIIVLHSLLYCYDDQITTGTKDASTP